MAARVAMHHHHRDETKTTPIERIQIKTSIKIFIMMILIIHRSIHIEPIAINIQKVLCLIKHMYGHHIQTKILTITLEIAPNQNII